MIQQNHRTFFILPNEEVIVYFSRCTMEAKIDFNYGKEKKAHWHERCGKLTKEQIKKENPHAEIYIMPDSRVSRFHINKINEISNEC